VPWSPNATVKINGTAVTNYTLEGVQISMGRDNVQQQSSAGFATIDFLDLPYTDVEIFDTITVTLDNYTGVDTTIFTGLVTDVSVSVLDAGTTNTFITQISASGALSELAAKEANIVGYAEQKDGDRIVSVVTDTFGLKWNELPATQVWTDYTTETWSSLLGVDVSAIDTPGTYDLFSSVAAPDPLNALNYVQIVADSGSGFIYETTSGGIGYQDQDARADYVSANGFVNISKNFILADGINVTTSRNDIINDVRVIYGAAQDVMQVEELDSISQYGRVTQSIETFLKNSGDADTLADRLVLLNAYPSPVIQGIQIQIDAPTMSSSLLNSLVGVFFGMPVSVTDFPALLYPNQFFGYIEGWQWEIDRFTARLTLNVSDFTFSAVPVAWQDVYAGEIWSTIDPSSAIRTLGSAIDTSLNTALGTKKAGLVLLNTTSFSGVSSQSINDVFSATYTNYKILLDTDASDADIGLSMRMRVSGADNTSNNYRWASGYKDTSAGAISGQSGSGLTSSFRVLAASSVGRCFSSIDIFNPFTAEETGYVGNYFQIASVGFAQFVAANMSVTTSYTGFTLIPTAGTITGTVSVYGYNK